MKRGLFVFPARLLKFSGRCWRPRVEWSIWSLRSLWRGKRRRTSDRSELIGDISWAVTEWWFLGKEVEKCCPVYRERAACGVVTVGLLVDCKSEAGISSGEAALMGILGGEEIGERKATTGLARISQPRLWNFGSLLQGRTELRSNRQRDKKFRLEPPRKWIRTHLNGDIGVTAEIDWAGLITRLNCSSFFLASSLISPSSSSIHKVFLSSCTAASAGARRLYMEVKLIREKCCMKRLERSYHTQAMRQPLHLFWSGVLQWPQQL